MSIQNANGGKSGATGAHRFIVDAIQLTELAGVVEHSRVHHV
jgi:hypothetical protein